MMRGVASGLAKVYTLASVDDDNAKQRMIDTLLLRLRPGDKAALRKLAGSMGVTMSEHIRRMALGDAEYIGRLKPEDCEAAPSVE